MKEIKIINKSKHDLPNYQTTGSAGMDLTASLTEPIILKPMERKLIPTGIFIALPSGLEAQIRSRSGMAFKRGLSVVNGIGTIDSDYRGEIMVALINLDQHDQTIVDGDRIAQMVIAKYETISWNQVETLDETERGAGGFNSTGTNKEEKIVDSKLNTKNLTEMLGDYSKYLSKEIDKSKIDDTEKQNIYNETVQETKILLDQYTEFLKTKK